VEQKSFLWSFINKVMVDGKTVTIDYTDAVHQRGAETTTSEVLAMLKSGSPGKCLRARSYGI
jgi:hypothetical protein